MKIKKLLSCTGIALVGAALVTTVANTAIRPVQVEIISPSNDVEEIVSYEIPAVVPLAEKELTVEVVEVEQVVDIVEVERVAKPIPLTYEECLTLDLNSPSGLSYDDIRRMMENFIERHGSGENMLSFIDVYIDVEQEFGVNAVFLLAKDCLESGYATSYLSEAQNNLSGWTSNNGGFMSFESKQACVQHVSESIKTNYLSSDGTHFRGNSDGLVTVSDVGVVYCESDSWASQVAWLMSELWACFLV